MDAHAHLISLGWQGDGHALDARPYKQKGHRGLAYDPKQVRSTGGNGLVKPLLISQRNHKFGIGKRAHEPAAGNEWWLAGFEKALGNVGKSESEREETSPSASGTATPESSTGYKGKHGGLYGFFVKGQAIGGTIGEQYHRTSKKRKSGEFGIGHAGWSDGDNSATAGSHLKRIDQPVEEFEQIGTFLAARDKDERRRKEKDEKVGTIEQFQQVGQFFEARSEWTRKGKPRPEQQRLPETVVEIEEEGDQSSRAETKEERRERRRRRKEEKALQAARTAGGVQPGVQSGELTRDHSDETAAKAARNAERRRKKDELKLSRNF